MAEIDENGDTYYDFGELNLLDVEKHELQRHKIRVYPSDDWEKEKTDVGDFAFYDMNNNQCNVTFPWVKQRFKYRWKIFLLSDFRKTVEERCTFSL